jgi:transposase
VRVRVTTTFNRMLGLPGDSVTGVSFERRGVVVRMRLRRRRKVCGRCGQLVRATHETNLRRWRHLDLGGSRCFIECELRRVRCPDCGVKVEAVGWARPGARHTRDFEDVVAFLAQQMAKTPIAGLMRIDWETVGRIVERVVADKLDEQRLKRLVLIGVDEVSWRRRHRYLTCVADHTTGRRRVDQARPQRRDLAGLLRPARRSREGVDPGGLDRHVGRLRAGDQGRDPRRRDLLRPLARRQARRRGRRPGSPPGVEHQGKSTTAGGKWVKGTRWSLLKAPERQSAEQLAILADVQQANRRLYRAFLLKEQLRLLYRLDDPSEAPQPLRARLSWASRSRLRPFVKLARTIREHRDGILTAIRLGLSNARLEGLNSKDRPISHRSFGFHSAAPLTALIHPCRGGIEIALPVKRSATRTPGDPVFIGITGWSRPGDMTTGRSRKHARRSRPVGLIHGTSTGNLNRPRRAAPHRRRSGGRIGRHPRRQGIGAHERDPGDQAERRARGGAGRRADCSHAIAKFEFERPVSRSAGRSRS